LTSKEGRVHINLVTHAEEVPLHSVLCTHGQSWETSERVPIHSCKSRAQSVTSDAGDWKDDSYLNFQSSYLSLPSVVITGMCHHTQLR
jgi:hypothetical protein